MADEELYFRQVAVGEMANLAYLVGSRTTREALVVDPAWDVDALLDQAEARRHEGRGRARHPLPPGPRRRRALRHRIPGLARLLARSPVPIHVNAHEALGVRRVAGVSETDLVRHEGGDVVELGGVKVRLLHTPGHTPGSQCFLVEAPHRPGSLVSGDTLFLGSCGRVDLPGSDPEAMYESLHTKLGRLPDETLLYPGHLYSAEPSSTLGEQKRTNPYLRVSRLDDFLTFLGV